MEDTAHGHGSAGVPDARTQLGPVAPTERIEIVDILRGFALFGVLLVNMHNFGPNLNPFGPDLIPIPVHFVAAVFTDAFFAMKSESLFSFLFGLGIALQLQRANARGVAFFPVYCRRAIGLFAIGFLHMLIYPGDILRTYALLGFVLLMFWKRASKTVLLAAVICLVAPYAFEGVSQGLALPTDPEIATVAQRDAHEAWTLRGAWSQREVRVLTQGSVSDVVVFNLHDDVRHGPYWGLWPFPMSWHSSWYLALFLLGLYVARRRLLEDISAHRIFFRRVLRWGLGIGLMGTVAMMAEDSLGRSPIPSWVIEFVVSIGAPALAFAYAAILIILFQRQWGNRMLKPLGAVGRMALTIYLFQSVVYTSIYYGYGLGFWGRLGSAHILPLALVIFALEILLCVWWLRRFRFGPAEWVWRTITYGRLQQVRLVRPAVPARAPAEAG